MSKQVRLTPQDATLPTWTRYEYNDLDETYPHEIQYMEPVARGSKQASTIWITDTEFLNLTKQCPQVQELVSLVRQYGALLAARPEGPWAVGDPELDEYENEVLNVAARLDKVLALLEVKDG